MEKPEILITKRGLAVRIEPAEPIVHILEQCCVYKRMVRRKSGPRGGMRTMFETEYLYHVKPDPTYDASGRLIPVSVEETYAETFAGLLPRITGALKANGYPFKAVEYPIRQVEPYLGWLNDGSVNLRDVQREMLTHFLTCERGQLDSVPASGKTFLLTQVCKCYPDPGTRLVFAVPSRVLLYSLHAALLKEFGPAEVGMVGGGSCDPNKHYVVATVHSLENIDASKVYAIFCDEVHKAGAPTFASSISAFAHSRMFGVSGTTEMRGDGSNLLVEALFGPVLMKYSYRQAVQDGILPDVETHFYYNELPSYDKDNRILRDGVFYWRNGVRNELIAALARYWGNKLYTEEGKDPQIMILVDKTEHVMYLQRLLPDFTAIYGDFSDKLKAALVKRGVVSPDFRPLRKKDADELSKQAIQGVQRRIIATGIMGTGVDMEYLDVFIRADGGSSDISNVQYRGRSARGARGFYLDILDVGDSREHGRAMKRFSDARKLGWKPNIIDFITGKEIMSKDLNDYKR